MKIAVISFISKDNKLSNIVQLYKNLNKKYCQINNYDFFFEYFQYNRNDYKNIFYYSKNQDYNKEFDTHVFLYHKFQLLEKYLRKYDYILFLDYDACFSNPYKKIQDLIDNTHDLYFITHSLLFGSTLWPNQISQMINNYIRLNHISYIQNFIEFCNLIKENNNGYQILNNLAAITCNPFSFNGGFILCKNSDIIVKFIQKVKLHHELFFHKSCDEGTMGMILQMKQFQNIFKVFPSYYMGNFNLAVQPQYYINDDKNFIMHTYGASREIKESGINYIKNNKFWKTIL